MIFIVGGIGLGHVPSRAQDHLLFESVQPFPVTELGEVMQAPFLGGFDTPRPQLVDIDADGDLDLFLQDGIGSVMHFANIGSRTNAQFEFRTRSYMDLEVGSWFFFADLDADDDLDLAAEQALGQIRLYRNDGTTSAPLFTAWVDTLKDVVGEIITTEPPTLPFLHDVDCDGRTDLMIGREIGTISRYELDHPDGAEPMPMFRFVEDRYGDIEVVGGTGRRSKVLRQRHGASAMAFADLDNDLDPDILWGDFFEPNIIHFENQGTCAAPVFQRVDDAYMRDAGLAVSTSGHNVPRPVDINADGQLDLVAGVLGGAFVPSTSSIDNLYLFVREGAGLQLRTRRLITSIDVGSDAAPALADVDNDGDLDMVVGNRIDASDPTRGSLTLIRNTTVGSTPSLDVESGDYLNFAGDFLTTPTFADIDADLDLDLFLGSFSGRLHLYQNSGSPSEPNYALTTNSFEGIDVGAESAPAFGDVDGDGDLDLLVGESSGKLNFFRNVGTIASAQYMLMTEDFAGIDVGQRSRPLLVDYDGDADLDLFVGTEANGVAYFRNDGTQQVAEFVAGDPLPVAADVVAPAAADFDRDGDLDLIVGTTSGGLRFLRNDRVTTGIERPEHGHRSVRIVSVFPNPAEVRLAVQLHSGYSSSVRVALFDVLGRTVVERWFQTPSGEFSIELPVLSLGRGVYVVRVETAGGASDVRKVVVR